MPTSDKNTTVTKEPRTTDSGAGTGISGSSGGVVLASTATSYSGPLPPPQAFAGYEQVLPGAAGRIIQMAEREQTARHDHHRQGQANEQAIMHRGQTFAAGLCVLAIAAFCFVSWLGHPWAGAVVVAAMSASFIRAFLGKPGAPPSAPELPPPPGKADTPDKQPK